MGKFAIDTSITFVTGIFRFVLGLGTSIIIARVLGPEGKGIYSLAILLPSLLINFGNLGISQASVFHIAKKTYSPEELLGNNVLLSFLLGIAGFFIGSLIILLFSDSLFAGVAKGYLFLALFLIPLQFFFLLVNSLLLGLQRIKEYNLIIISQSFMFLVLLALFLFVPKFGIELAISANILSYLLGLAVLFYLTKKIIGVFHLFFSGSYLRDAFRYGFKVYLGNVILFLHYKIDLFLLNIFLNPTAVGFYSVSTALAEKIWVVSQSAGLVLFPRVSSETDERRLKEFTPIVCRNVLLITLIGAILLFFLGQLLIVFFYSQKFSASVLPFQILLIGATTMSGWRVLANDLYGRGRPELNIYISLASVILNIALNVLWIPRFGISGAASATSISYTFAFVVITIVYAKISGNNIWHIVLPQRPDFHFYNSLVRRVI